MNERFEQLISWLQQQTGQSEIQLTPASSDASFRRYFRLQQTNGSYIVMDAPPPQEDCRPFIAVATQLRAAGVNVPEIFASDVEQGFLLLTDFGSTLYLQQLAADTVDTLYQAALKALLRLQQTDSSQLPPYDAELLHREMHLFSDWLVGTHLQITLSAEEQTALYDCFQQLADSALAQPQVFVHRDYHSRNLMYLDDSILNPAILDFQDAVKGAVTYDLVSLLRDCYIQWPLAQIHAWVEQYQDQLQQAGVIAPVSRETFLQWFDWMGIQRHLKASGIFARLFYRDGKDGYLADIPRTLGYISSVIPNYPSLAPLQQLLEQRVLPALQEK